MKKSGAELAVFALEQLNVQYTFGIPGVHNTELYDALGNSKSITPILVTHEGAGAFAADAFARTGGGIGVLAIVPAAGATNAMSGIGEACLAGVPMLVISGGVRRDSGRHYQLHDIDQARLVGAVVKRYDLVARHADIIPAIYAAYETAIDDEPGPVFVELPADLLMFEGEVAELKPYTPRLRMELEPTFRPEAIEQAVDFLTRARRPGIVAGWGAAGAADHTARLAERLVTPVATSLQGLSAFPARHPLHAGMGFGAAAVPAARKAFAGCDCLLAAGVRFGELATGSYSMPVPEALIHIDVNPDVFHKNYPAAVTLEGDASEVLAALADALDRRDWHSPRSADALASQIRRDKESYLRSWTGRPQRRRVSPGIFFRALRTRLPADAIVVADDGAHTFLTAELFPVYRPRGFISPTDFNCMGYAVPGAIGAKLANPDTPVVAIVGDGACLMTGMELLTAATRGIGIAVFVFHDGTLGQIAQYQEIPLNRKTCTVLGKIDFAGLAQATGASYLALRHDGEVESVLQAALDTAASGRPCLVDVNIDYSRRTCFTRGTVMANLGRFPAAEKVRYVARAAKRRITG